MDVLRDCAPVTASGVRPPRVLAEREAAEGATASWTEELREFFALRDGQAFRSEDDQFVGEVLPGVELLSLEQVVTRHKLCSEILHPIDDLGPDWPATVRAQHAGETAEMFVPEYIPFAEDGAGDFLYVDTREGEQQGCIRYFAAEAADEGGPLFGSLTEYGDSVRRSVESGSEHSYLVPSVTEGCWRGMSTFPIDLRWLRSRIRRRCIFCSRSVTFSPRKSPSMTTLSTSMSFARLSSTPHGRFILVRRCRAGKWFSGGSHANVG